MKLAKQIAEEQERSGVAYGDDLCACFDIYVAEKIIADKLEPVKAKLRQLVNEGIDRFSVEASAEQPWKWDSLGNAPTLKNLAKEILAMFEEE